MPIPRLTYSPSLSSAATRAANCVLVSGMSRPLRRLVRTGREAFDLLAAVADLDHPLHEHTRRVDLLGIQFARLDEGFDLGNRDPTGRGRERVEVAGRRVVHEVSVPVAPRGTYQRKVGDDAALEDVELPVEVPHFLRWGGDCDRPVGRVAPG